MILIYEVPGYSRIYDKYINKLSKFLPDSAP
jgi:hypothetical protein